MSKLADYPFEIRPLNSEEGGGFLISYPDFSECISVGETVEGALKNGKDALKPTIAALKAKDLPVPAAKDPERTQLMVWCVSQRTLLQDRRQRSMFVHSAPVLGR